MQWCCVVGIFGLPASKSRQTKGSARPDHRERTKRVRKLKLQVTRLLRVRCTMSAQQRQRTTHARGAHKHTQCSAMACACAKHKRERKREREKEEKEDSREMISCSNHLSSIHGCWQFGVLGDMDEYAPRMHPLHIISTCSAFMCSISRWGNRYMDTRKMILRNTLVLHICGVLSLAHRDCKGN